MSSLFSFIFFVLLPLAIGIVTIYLSIDFFEYLKKYHPPKYKQMSFASLFGISNESFIFHLIKPQEFFRFLLSPADLQDNNVKVYKSRIRLSLLALTGLFVIIVLCPSFSKGVTNPGNTPNLLASGQHTPLPNATIPHQPMNI